MKPAASLAFVREWLILGTPPATGAPPAGAGLLAGVARVNGRSRQTETRS